jgi:cytochrome c-type biogenesis protein CcmH
VSSSWNRTLKRWPAWVLLVLVVVGFLAVGATRSNGPSTPEERAERLEQHVACPTCSGESVYESRATASEAIKTRIRTLVDEGQLTDDQIIGTIEQSFGAQVLLVPKATGFDALVWALPVAALVCAIAGLAVTFRRWRREAATQTDPTEDDRELVAAAMRSEDDSPPPERDP